MNTPSGSASGDPLPASPRVHLDPQSASVLAVASGARVAGIVIALGYLLGAVDGPLVVVVGALGLITYSRAVLLERTPAALLCASLAVVAGALGVGALRWETLVLGDLRGAQAVLGPTILVGPQAAAIASGAAAAAALVASGVWIGPRVEHGRSASVWSLIEGAVATLAIVTVYFDPAEQAYSGGGGRVLLQLARWAVVVIVGLAASLAVGELSRRGPSFLRWVLLAAAGIAVVVAGALVAGTL